ncbi:MAG: NAD-dependent DNA ligase LigA [Candidatus Moraniibacteriota bacterium]
MIEPNPKLIDIKKRMEILRREVERLRYRYHVLDDPAVTDETYTSLRHELLKLEEKYPEFKIPNSPTERIGGKPLAKFVKVNHPVRQWSLDDVFGREELADWEGKNLRILEKTVGKKVKFNYIAEIKIDGLHIVLTYRNGILVTGATRGDGIIGEDVTQNIKTIESIPLVLKEKVDVVVEGECWLSKKELERINKEREKIGLPLFANARNAAAGSIRQLDPKIAAGRKLDSFLYQLHPVPGGNFPYKLTTQKEKLEILEKLAFKVNPLYKSCNSLGEVEAFFHLFAQKRNSLQFGVDGLVVKVSKLEYQEKLGYTGKSPRWGIAYKFPAETTTTQVLDIRVQVGRTGALTPVAILKPVAIAGSVVSRASLHNVEEIKRLDVKIGDTVVLRKAGDVIPEVVEVLKKLRSGQEKRFKMPSRCPVCGSPVEKRYLAKEKQEAAVYCSNKKCFAQEREKLIHFASKIGFSIEGLGDKIVGQLMETGLIRDFSDIFRLKEGDLMPLERFAELSAKNLVEAIKDSKTVKIEKFITALGIRYIGEESAILVAKKIMGNIGGNDSPISPIKIFNQAGKFSIGDWQEVKGLGDKAAGSLYDYFHDKKNLREFNQLTKYGVRIIIEQTRTAKSNIQGKSFVFTGALPNLGRDVAKEMARNAGGEISSSVSKNTDYVVAGSDYGSKLGKAKELGVKIIGEQEFLKLLK